MTRHQNPPFRAEHLGSLLRTETLVKKRDLLTEGKVTPKELIPIEDQDIKDIVAKQLELGYHAITDGEYRRHMFWGSFFPNLEGFTQIMRPDAGMFRLYMPDIAAFVEEKVEPGETVVCTGKIKHKGSSYVDDFKFLAGLVKPEEVKNIKITLAAPNWYHMRYKEGYAYSKEAYSSDEEYFADIAKAYQEELQILYDAGCRNVQYDDPNLAYFCSEKMIEGWNSDPLNKGTTEDLLDKYIKLYNDCIAKRPADLHVGVHLCRGNFHNSRHFSEGGYDRIAVKLFKELNVDTYYLEYDTPRAGGFEPLKELPVTKNVILGVVTSKFDTMEDKEEMKKRIVDAAKFIAEGNNISVEEALKQCGVSPQCGFASHHGGNAISREGMFKKLKLVREIADEIWPNEP
ncbi:Methionine synthase, vitamin-B12 independent, putative [Talaromyces stipitatus ATCC 10500]|uniref:Methionine synthase, vitamin-B12 independent, putative n=1 Tax=Talaromyces stipitatus (strain ATCC 10500 / CBS 375.48 / QM 6759 / NRRL 1006) TaxID=441959 RepID=B8M526_TALSN|nr:Methionine synthase, vitamin-B12 independent, putative [Talaromyces stipitatus ATCC 10500]XP_002480067.1 Methionine synthase, vitamin-B12 independent, putative [Talaromyces stipitatus ATCC 10500]XP_002480068.1 Methionine synthase, vitamin-B12 independent, putative [Talaromyces stipitatus ATCC 10500]EED19632.1 Methionine synthase, vitamin-B12 independent, putative [Talaromyces stipitatus ATCC 10500]EED19633.1 Methionine synthase, vitamin-B12 independent, putative [Talaromyces stipitatus ATCC 